MTFSKRAPYAVLATAVVLLVGLGGATYATAQITGADIKNDTVTSADIKNFTLKYKDFSHRALPVARVKTQGADVALSDVGFTTIVTWTPPVGMYLASVTGTVFEETTGDAQADCRLTGGDFAAPGDTAVTIPSGGLYATVATQEPFDAGHQNAIVFECEGTNAGITQVRLSLIKVATIQVSRG